MLATNAVSENTESVTETLLEFIRQGKATTDRLLRENASLRAEVARLMAENADLRAGLGRENGDTFS
jgi:cell division protein FtsB